MAKARRRYSNKRRSYGKKKVYRRSKKTSYKRRPRRRTFRKRTSRRYKIRKSLRRHYKKRRYLKESRYPVSSKLGRRINRRSGSQAFIDYYKQISAAQLGEDITPFNKSLWKDLVSYLCRRKLFRGLNALACIVTQIPYSKYYTLPDHLKQVCSHLHLIAKMKAEAYRHLMLQPGAFTEAKLIRRHIQQAEVRNVQAAISARAQQVMHGLAAGLGRMPPVHGPGGLSFTPEV